MSAIPPLSLDQHLCYSLYSASLAIGRAYKPVLDAMGITYPQYLVLSVLWEKDNLPVGMIADRLLLESSTLTPLLKRLEAAGMVQRTRNPEDERQVLIQLTGQGRALREQSVCLAQTMLETSGLSMQQIGALNDQVRALRDSVATALNER
ncbi:MarR family winged helix-turn-helix transcriptional regulator [Sphingomonas sp. PR090111-T3T-6A]|uniref:MarR family winged helix-turn-helix transcriptional regulator n=1 Tax=Sphingomonas sp. PR090111-T3T-6A TaxID=685778 RepID=UPI0003765BFC|nr:MarR family transcriptional regulator [Sphingomonas sp. PR090111-T3T-6A]